MPITSGDSYMSNWRSRIAAIQYVGVSYDMHEQHDELKLPFSSRGKMLLS